MKYSITYWEDEFTMIDEIEVEVDNVSELKKLADDYYDKNLKDKNVGGARWRKIN